MEGSFDSVGQIGFETMHAVAIQVQAAPPVAHLCLSAICKSMHSLHKTEQNTAFYEPDGDNKSIIVLLCNPHRDNRPLRLDRREQLVFFQ